jgi:hypothetical protein
MILMKAVWDFLVPDVAATKLVEISALRHEHVALPKGIARNQWSFDGDLLDLAQIKKSILDVRNSEIWEADGVHFGLFTECQASLHVSYSA